MSKEHAYAYEAGYRDGSIHYELEHCPACKNVADLQEALAENAKLRDERREYQATIDSLVDECADHKAENAKLRDELDAAKHDLSLFSERIVELGAENAKLRELVDYMTPIALYGASEQECDRMRELGIEAG